MVIIAPSLLAADLMQVGKQIHELESHGADWFHVDIMDGHFVPNLSFGPSFVKAVRRTSNVPLAAHLMIENADFFLHDFRNAGADYITVQYESSVHLWRTVETIKNLGARAGVALNPATSIQVLEYIFEIVDLVLVMTVEPGFGGQSFIPHTLSKVKALSDLKKNRGYQFLIEVDGGIDISTARSAVQAGAEVLVAGTGIFKEMDIGKALDDLRTAALT